MSDSSIRRVSGVVALIFVSALAAGHAVAADIVHFTPLPRGAGVDGYEVSLGDLDGDGRPDAVACRFEQLRVYPGQGGGSFGTPFIFDVGADCYATAIADLNGDDKLDVVVPQADPINPSRSFLIVLAGAGDGTLSELDGHALGGLPTSVVTGDFDGDGALDVGVNDADNDRVVVFPGNGDGTLEPPARIPVGGRPWDLDVGDFNQDGVDDLVAVSVVGQDFTVLLGRRNGTPDPLPSQALRRAPSTIAAGDLVDGPAVDLAIGWYDSPGVKVLHGDSQGHFTDQMLLRTSEQSYDLALAQLNGDARLDIVVAELNSVDTYFGRPGSRFTRPTIYSVGHAHRGGFIIPDSVAIGDLNLDGRPDMLAAARWLRDYLQRPRPYTCRGRVANVIGSNEADDLPRVRRMSFGLIVHLGAGGDGIGTARYSDVVCLGPGPDGGSTYGGDDRIFAGPGADDNVKGNGGSDELFGGRGDDQLGQNTRASEPERGADILHGGSGDDRLKGGPGRDVLRGGRGWDRCIGGSGQDRAIGCERKRAIP